MYTSAETQRKEAGFGFGKKMIDAIGDFLQQNLTVLLALLLVPLKIAVIRFCRDREGEAGAVLSIPEDLCYVALGLILADVMNARGSLHRHYTFSKHPSIDLALVIGFNVAIALVIHLLSQPTIRQYQKWRGADSARGSSAPQQGQLDFVAAAADKDSMHLIAHHLSAMGILYVIQLTLVIVWLHWLAKVIQDV